MAIYVLSVKHKAKGKGASARAHALYIAREGKYAARQHAEYLSREGEHKARASELEYIGHGNMPEWARDNPMSFWEAADTFERANGRVYTEILVALPRELKRGERLELVREFVGEELGEKHVYSVAIHNPKALDGGEQPHAHIMFSNRELDGIERGRELFFRRANTKQAELGGAKKSREWSQDAAGHDKVAELRKSWERHANLALQVAGLELTIDRRSLLERGIEREPEPKMGPAVTQMVKRGRWLETDVGESVFKLREERRLSQELELEQRQHAKRMAELSAEREEQAKIIDFERAKRERRLEQSISFSGTAREVSEGERQRYRRTVDYVMDRVQTDSGVEFRWKKSGQRAFIDRGDKILFDTTNETAVKAGMQLAKEKGWDVVQVWGREDFRREAWLQGELLRLKVSGYEATLEDQQELSKRRKELERRQEQYLEREQARERPAAVLEQAQEQSRPEREQQNGERISLTGVQAAELLWERRIEPIQKERYRLSEQLRALGSEPPLTKDAAEALACDEIGGKGFVADRNLAKKLDREAQQWEARYDDFKREQEERGPWRFRPKYWRMERELLEQRNRATDRYNEVVERYNKRLLQTQTPEMQKRIDERTGALLELDHERIAQRQALSKKSEALLEQQQKAYQLKRDFEVLGKQQVELERVGNELRIANLEQFQNQVQRARELKQKREMSLGLGLER